jgi:hypothetical protein
MWFSAVSRSLIRQNDKNSTSRLLPIVMMSPIRLDQKWDAFCEAVHNVMTNTLLPADSKGVMVALRPAPRSPGAGRRATITPLLSAGSRVLVITLCTASQKASHCDP